MAMLKHYAQDAPRNLSDILLFEVDQRWSREQGILSPVDQEIPMGSVLIQNEDGKYAPYAVSAPVANTEKTEEEAGEAKATSESSTGSPVLAILISRDIASSEQDQPCAVIRRGACVSVRNLAWDATITDDQKKDALKILTNQGIVPKE